MGRKRSVAFVASQAGGRDQLPIAHLLFPDTVLHVKDPRGGAVGVDGLQVLTERSLGARQAASFSVGMMTEIGMK